MKTFKITTTALLLAGLVTGCGSSGGGTKSADGSLEIRYQGNVGSVAPPELAEDLGYLKGVKLKWVGNTISGPQDIQSVASNQTDIGSAFNGAVIKLAAAKVPITAVISSYGSDKHTAIGFWALDGSPIKGPRDLIGKKIGVNTLGAHAEAVIKEYLKRGGLKPDEIKQVELIVVPPVNAEQSLRQKQIDVAQLGGILRDKAVERGGIRAVFKDTDLLGEFNAGTYVLRDDFIKKHPAEVKILVDGIAKAYEWSKTQPRETVVARLKQIIAKRARSEDATAVGYWKSFGVSSKGGVVAEKELQIWIDWLVGAGEIKSGDVKAADLFTNEYNPFGTAAK